MKIKFPSKRKIKRFFKKIIKIIEIPEEVMPFDYVKEILIKECLHEDPFSGRGKLIFDECLKFFRDRSYKGLKKFNKKIYIEPEEWVMLNIALTILRDEPILHRYNDVDIYSVTFNSFGKWYLNESPLYYEACQHLGICLDSKLSSVQLHEIFVKAHRSKRLSEVPKRLTLTEKVYNNYKKEFSDQSRYRIVIPPTMAQVRSECAYPGQKLINTDDTNLQIPLETSVSNDGYIEKLIRYSDVSNVAVYEKTDEHIWDILYPAWGKELREGKRQYRKD